MSLVIDNGTATADPPKRKARVPNHPTVGTLIDLITRMPLIEYSVADKATLRRIARRALELECAQEPAP